MESKPILSRFRNSITAQSIRRGLTLAIPFLTLGSFSLLFLNFPSDSYQTFLHNFLNGSAVALLTTLYNISLGSLALVLCITISLSYGLLAEIDMYILYPVVALCSAEAYRIMRNTYLMRNGFLQPCSSHWRPVFSSAGY